MYLQIKMQDSIHPYIHSLQRSMQSKETCSFWGWGCSWLKVFQDFWNAQLRRRFCTNCYMPKRICHSVHTFSCPGYAHIVYGAHTAQCTYSAQCTYCTVHIVDIQCTLSRVQCIVYCEWAFWPPPDIGLGIDVQGQESISASESENI